MIELSDKIATLPKVGPKFKGRLKNLGIETIEDLLYHFPFRYEDYSMTKQIADLLDGEVVTIEGDLDDIRNIYTKYGKKLTNVQISDQTGKVNIVWFNQHYLKQTFRVGERYRFSGKVGRFNNKLCLISPDYEELSKNNGLLHTGRLVPVYPETAGLSSKYLRNRINDILSDVKSFEEFLPENTLKKHKLMDLDHALRSIHFPNNRNESNMARRRFAFEELLLELLKVEQRKYEWKNSLKGKAFEKILHREKLDDFVDSLPFKLTNSQETAVEEIMSDLTMEHPMNRLLEGDVGTGKTIVAIIASYFTVLNKHQVLYMAPTEILANQHYNTYLNLLKPLGISVSLMTGSTKKSDRHTTDIIVGTHALLYSKEKFENIGLVVVDEQHRFGVEQRTRIMQMGKNDFIPHLLTMTATPIPRTLALTLFGDLNISILKTPPNKNKKITTKVIPESKRDEAYEAIRNKGEPTFIVCPLIEESESLILENVKAAEAEYIRLKNGVFKDINIGLLHGRMKSKEKQEVVDKFKSGEIKVLVSTPVIEVGIDIPEATVMVIESAERYGLASLHQLRGRVGRGDKPGICLVFMSNNSTTSYQRLKNLEDISDGLQLAEFDLRTRGQGDLYGTMQHGFKKFKCADINDLEMLETVKLEAQQLFSELDSYTNLKKKLNDNLQETVGNN